MAQVWLSFEEIQELFRCEAADARRRVVASQWERRRCSDGLVRAQVPADVAHDFFMSRHSGQPQSQPAPARQTAGEFEAAMQTLCRIFAEDAATLTASGRTADLDRTVLQPEAQVRSAA